jgi:F0F1-type ATP synthase delta subunit
MKAHYIQAALELLKEGKDINDVLTGLKRILRTRGYMKLYRGVLLDLLEALSEKSSDDIAVVTVARESDLELLKLDIKSELKEINRDGYYRNVIDESLIGSTVVTDGDLLRDRSYKRRLTDMYRSVTKYY